MYDVSLISLTKIASNPSKFWPKLQPYNESDKNKQRFLIKRALDVQQQQQMCNNLDNSSDHGLKERKEKGN